jgi:hypothetical protein
LEVARQVNSQKQDEKQTREGHEQLATQGAREHVNNPLHKKELSGFGQS